METMLMAKSSSVTLAKIYETIVCKTMGLYLVVSCGMGAPNPGVRMQRSKVRVTRD